MKAHRVSDAKAAVSELARVFNPAAIRAGQALTLTFGPPHRATLITPLLAIAFKPNVERDIAVVREGDGAFKADQTVKVLTARSDHAAGAIDGSLYLSARTQGVPDGVIVDLIKIFSYDVDFQREVRSGDTVRARLYQLLRPRRGANQRRRHRLCRAHALGRAQRALPLHH